MPLKNLHPCVAARYFKPEQPLCPLGAALARQQLGSVGGVSLPSGVDQITALDPQGILLVTGTDEGIRRMQEYVSFLDTSTKPMEVGVQFIQHDPAALAQTFPVAGRISEGAGVIWRMDGFIVTTQSVTSGAEKVEVTLNDGRTMEAKVIGADPTMDLAVVKVDATGLPAAKLGDSNRAKVGEQVFAVGHPAGYAGTVVTGIVSGLNRTLNLGNQTLFGLIQTDLAIAPGYSGGPLANARGEVIGINFALLRTPRPSSISPFEGGGFAPAPPNISFALPIAEVKRITEDVIAHGKVLRAFLGVRLEDVNEERQKQAKLPDRKGAVVSQVSPDSPAQKADIKAGDVIRRIGNKDIANAPAASEEIRSRKPGDKMTLEIWRDGAMQTVEVTLTEAPREMLMPPPQFPAILNTPFAPNFRGQDFVFPPEATIFASRMVRIVSPKENETVKGTVLIRLAIAGRERYGWLGVWVDDQFITVVKFSDEPFPLDTTKFTNGTHTVRVKVISLNNDFSPGASVRVKVENEK
jgi:S1-C subfamily serine protease